MAYPAVARVVVGKGAETEIYYSHRLTEKRLIPSCKKQERMITEYNLEQMSAFKNKK